MDFPQQFGPYTLERFVAAGGMAEVFLARRADGAIDGPIALKRMLAEMMKTPEYATMFRDEAALSSRLLHKNIVRVFDFGETDGRMYMAMEFVDGMDVATLQKKLRAKNEMLGVPHALQIGVELCAGLFHAHSLADDHGRLLKLIHRDISPQNLMVSGAGDVKVTDFGIAKATGRETKTATGMIKGKVQYMAPEQALGHHIDQRVDQFAAGIVVWEMLTGSRLFAEKSELLTFEKIIRTPTPRPSSVRSAVPAHVDEVVLRALAKNPEERYPDLNAFGVALSQSLAKLGGPGVADLAPVMQYVMGGSGALLPAPPVATPRSQAQARAAPPAQATSQSTAHMPPLTAKPAPKPAAASAPVVPVTPMAQKRSGLSVVSPATAPTIVTPGARLPTNAMTPLPMLSRDETPGAMAAMSSSGLDVQTRGLSPTVRLPTPAMAIRPAGVESAPRTEQRSQVLAAAAPRGFPIGALVAGAVIGGVLAFGAAKMFSAPVNRELCHPQSSNRDEREKAALLFDNAEAALNSSDLPRAAKITEAALKVSASARGYALLAKIDTTNGDLAQAFLDDHCIVLAFPDSEEAKRLNEQMKPRPLKAPREADESPSPSPSPAPAPAPTDPAPPPGTVTP